MSIKSFEGKYEFLSNFYPSPILVDGISYPTVEHAFQATKSLSKEERVEIAKALTPGQAKRLGRKVKLRDDWETVKDEVMKTFVRAKFETNRELRKRLLETGNEFLVEGNTWHDNYWGNCSCEKCKNIKGKNQLGKTLMQVREELLHDNIAKETCGFKPPKRSVLVVVDMQNDFIDGSLGTKEAVEIVPRVAEKLNGDFRNIIFTRDTHELNYMDTMEGKHLPIEHCIHKSEGWKISEHLKVPDDKTGIIIDKPTFGSVYLMNLLKNIKEEADRDGQEFEITFVGLCTDICVISNVLMAKAFFPETRIIVDAFCCAGVTPESHKEALDVMKMCHIEVINE